LILSIYIEGKARKSLAVYGLIFTALLVVAVSGPSRAAESKLKEESQTESKVVLDDSQPWFSAEDGRYKSGWSENYAFHISNAVWKKGRSFLVVSASSPSGLYRWGANQTQIKEHDLKAQFGEDLTLFEEVDCGARTCVSFSLSQMKCFMVRYFPVPPGSITQSDKGINLVEVFYCAQDLRMPEDMDLLLSAISIRK